MHFAHTYKNRGLQLYMFQVSWDQNVSHQVLESWVARVLDGPEISGISAPSSCKQAEGMGFQVMFMMILSYLTMQPRKDPIVMKCCCCKQAPNEESAQEMRSKFAHECINKIDSMFGRKLGCRISPVLSKYVDMDNHLHRREQVTKMKMEKERRREARRQQQEAAGGSQQQ